MSDPTQISHESDDPQLVEAVQQYIAATEAGRRPLRRDFLARYPDITEDLAACLDGLAFVESAAGRLNETEPHDELMIDPAAAKPLGDFRLIRQIGRGGMGVVYEAEQVSLGRRVALKVLPLAAALDPRQLQRFRNEALAAAQLHHTNVVPVHAVGCERSVHFYAMQLIDGQSLADVIRELSVNHEPTYLPSSSLATLRSDKRREFHRTIALLGAQAADGLAYAHGMGVIHRDIKPGNLLLDTAGTLWIADFGLAQLHTNTAIDGLTRSGDILGTLRYMSPEQASGRAVLLDQRTDLYALGATLFELLTLQPAVSGQDQMQMLQSINELEPPSARAIDPSIPAELDVILGKAMAKDVVDRYQSADELAADLRRYLDDQPIKAKAPSLTQKLARWTRRHRRGVAVGVGVLALMSASLLITTILISRANLEVKRAYAAERERTQEAELSYRQTREVVDLLTRFAAEELVNDPLADDERRALLAVAMDYYQNFSDTRGAQAADADEIQRARQTINAILDEIAATEQLRRVGERAELLSLRPVGVELGIARDDIDLSTLYEAFSFDMEEALELTPQARRQRFEALAANGRRALDEALTEPQRERLEQITWQIQGVRAFAEPAVVSALELTAEQKIAVEKIMAATREAWEIYNPAQPPGRPEDRAEDRHSDHPGSRLDHVSDAPNARRETAQKIHADGLAAALQLLRSEQFTRWENLIGQPFSRETIDTHHGSGLGPIFGSRPQRKGSDGPPPHR